MTTSQTADTLPQAEELELLVESARDALTEDMVGRLSATLGQGLDLLDRINRSGLERALPTITRLVENDDLERIVHLARVLDAAEDATNEEMLGRMAGTLGEGLDLLDRVNRSRLVDALPALTNLVETGDLDRIVHLVRLFAAAEDSVNDEMISRMAGVATNALCLIEQLTRNGDLERILTFFLRPEMQNVLVRFGEALLATSTEYEQMPPPKGGLGGLWKMLREPGNQQAMQFLGVFGRHLHEPHH